MDNEMRHLYIEIEKKGIGYDATLSDDSIDRDGEFFSPELIKAWASETMPLPFLANHENSMQNLIGVWSNRIVAIENGQTSLKMTPSFFSAEANPLAQQIKTQIDEATNAGLRVGLSIGFIPKDGMLVGNRYMHTNAELLEGSAVPVQSNRNASISFSKSFKFEKMDSLKKTSAVPNVGGSMTELEIITKQLAESQAKNTALETKLAELAAKKPELTEEQKALIETAKKDAEEARKKFEESEKKISEELKTVKEQYEAAKKEHESLKGKIPAEMLGNAGVAKEKAKAIEPFNATNAFLKLKGIPVE